LQPLAPDESCTTASGIAGLGADPLTETKLMRSEPVLGETYSGLIAVLEDVECGTLMVKVALPCELFGATCEPGTEPPPPHPATAKRPAINATLRRIR